MHSDFKVVQGRSTYKANACPSKASALALQVDRPRNTSRSEAAAIFYKPVYVETGEILPQRHFDEHWKVVWPDQHFAFMWEWVILALAQHSRYVLVLERRAAEPNLNVQQQRPGLSRTKAADGNVSAKSANTKKKKKKKEKKVSGYYSPQLSCFFFFYKRYNWHASMYRDFH